MTIHPVPGLDSRNGHTVTFCFIFLKPLLSSFECLPTSLCTSQEMNFECQPEAAEALNRFAQGVVLVAQWQQDSGYTVTLSKKVMYSMYCMMRLLRIDVFVVTLI